MRIGIIFLAFWACFEVSFPGSPGGGVFAGPVPATEEFVSLEVQDAPVSPIQSDHSVEDDFGLLHGPMKITRKHTRRFGKWSTAAVAAGRPKKHKTVKWDEVEIPFQDKSEDEEVSGCTKRADATLTIVSHRRGRVFLSWSEICEREVKINVPRFKRTTPEKKPLGCKYTNPSFGYGSDEMNDALSTLLTNMLEQVLNQFVLGCIGLFYRYAEINWGNQSALNSTVTEMWPAVQLF